LNRLDSLIREEKQLRSTQEILLKEKHTASARLATLDQQLIELEQELEQADRINFESVLLEAFGIYEYFEAIKSSLFHLYKIRFAVKESN